MYEYFSVADYTRNRVQNISVFSEGPLTSGEGFPPFINAYENTLFIAYPLRSDKMRRFASFINMQSARMCTLINYVINYQLETE